MQNRRTMAFDRIWTSLERKRGDPGISISWMGNKMKTEGDMDGRTEQHLLLDDIASVTAPRDTDYERIVDGVGIGLTQIDAGTGRIRYANPSFCRMVGYSAAEIVDQALTFLELTHPDDRANNVDLHKLLIAGEIDDYTIEKRYIRKDKSVFWGRMTATALDRDADHRALVTLRAIQNITKTRDREEILGNAERIAGVARWFRDFETGTATCSEGYNSLFGLPPSAPAPSFDEFLARVHPDDRERVISTSQRAWKGNMFSCEHRIVRPGGEIRWLSHTVKRICDSAGRILGQVGTCVDITDFKEPAVSTSRPSVVSFRHFVDSNWDQDIDLAAAAKVVNLSIRSLHRRCQSAWGITPNQYIKRIRLEKSREMLQLPDRDSTVTQIALRCRFHNVGHFAKDYRSSFGELPSETLRRAKATT